MKIIYLSKEHPVFRWIVFKEDVFTVGMKGTGKTERIKKILDTIPNYPYWIWSPQRPEEKYGKHADPVDEIKKLEYGQQVYTGIYNEENYVKFCNKAFHETGNIVLVRDDIHEVVTKHSVLMALSTLVQSGRNRGICSIFGATNPAVVPNWILGNVSVSISYKVKLESHAEWLANNYFGKDAWILLPKDMRKKNCFDTPEDMDIIPPYSYLIRHDNETESTLVINDE